MLIYCKFHFMLFCPYFHVFSIVHIEKCVCCLVPLYIYLFYRCVIDGVCMLRPCFPFSLNGSTVGFYFLGRYLKTKCYRRKWDEHDVIHTFRLGNAVVSFTWRHFRFRCVQHMYLYIYMHSTTDSSRDTIRSTVKKHRGFEMLSFLSKEHWNSVFTWNLQNNTKGKEIFVVACLSLRQ